MWIAFGTFYTVSDCYLVLLVICSLPFSFFFVAAVSVCVRRRSLFLFCKRVCAVAIFIVLAAIKVSVFLGFGTTEWFYDHWELTSAMELLTDKRI